MRPPFIGSMTKHFETASLFVEDDGSVLVLPAGNGRTRLISPVF